MIKQNAITAILLTSAAAFAFSQEALKSTEEEYYDFLSLDGIVERPFLNHRTLSDSVWNIPGTSDDATVSETTNAMRTSDGNIWYKNNLGTQKKITEHLSYKLFGPEWFNSYNTAEPYGQNDGALWQGKGYNTSLTSGAMFNAYGFSVTIKPQLCFQQNLSYSYIAPDYSGADYAGKAGTYGYYGIASIDAPQRFGDSSFWTFDWGDSEIRYSWKTLTLGFGTQAAWTGPAQLNPIISSNNAPSYPKFDIGLRRQRIVMPWTHWYLGDIEARGWWGCLTESDYFDNDSSNNHNLIAGLSAAWSLPGLFKGLTIGFNRTMLSKWDDINEYSLFKIYTLGMSNESGNDENDQRFSLTLDYGIPKAGFELYLEWARNDYSPEISYTLAYPFHTQGWTLGAKKTLHFSDKIRGVFSIECTNLECSHDYETVVGWYSTFYAHHIIKQGYTNRGQWLGAGIGTGGNSQYIGFKLYHPKGYFDFFFQRRNPDLDYVWFIESKNNSMTEDQIRVLLDFGTSAYYYLTRDFSGKCTFVLTDDRYSLPVNDSRAESDTINISLEVSLKYLL